MPKRKTFFYIISLKKIKEMKSNQKSHLIHFKLILLRTNQNSVFKIGHERASLHFFCVFRVFFFLFFSASCTVHGTWTVHLGLWTVTRTVHARRLHCARDIVHYSRTIYVLFTGPTITLFRKKILKMGPMVLFTHFKKKKILLCFQFSTK